MCSGCLNHGHWIFRVLIAVWCGGNSPQGQACLPFHPSSVRSSWWFRGEEDPRPHSLIVTLEGELDEIAGEIVLYHQNPNILILCFRSDLTWRLGMMRSELSKFLKMLLIYKKQQQIHLWVWRESYSCLGQVGWSFHWQFWGSGS